MTNDLFSPDSLAALIASVRRLPSFPGQHVAFQPTNPEGSVYVLAADLCSMSAGGSMHWGRDTDHYAQIATQLYLLLTWARTDPSYARELGLIVAEDHPDTDLDCSDEDHPGTGHLIAAAQLCCLRRAKIELVVLCPRGEMIIRKEITQV